MPIGFCFTTSLGCRPLDVTKFLIAPAAITRARGEEGPGGVVAAAYKINFKPGGLRGATTLLRNFGVTMLQMQSKYFSQYVEEQEW